MAGSRSDTDSASSSDSERSRPAAPVAPLPDDEAAPGAAPPVHAAIAGGSARPSRDQSSNEGSDVERRRRRRDKAGKAEKPRRKDKGLKVKKSSSKEKKQKRKRKKEEKERRKDQGAAGPVQLSKFLQSNEDSSGTKYSAVSGKKIKLKVEKTKADREAERNRSALLAVLNASYD